MSERPFVLPEPELIETVQIPQDELPSDVLHHSEAVYRSVELAADPIVTNTETPRFSLREWWREKRITQKLGHTAAVLTAVLGTIAVEASPAAADGSQVHHVYNTGGEGLWLHPDTPGLHTKTSDLMGEGDEFDPDCWKQSDNVNGDSIWLHGTHVATGNTGFAADFFADTDTHQGQEGQELTEQGIPECGGTSNNASAQNNSLQPAESLQGASATPEQTNIYNGQAAADWAYANGMDQPPTDGSCTWFASNALWQGGLVKTSEWTSAGHLSSDIERLRHYTSKNPDYNLPGTTAAWNVIAFKNYLQKTYPNSTWESIDFSPANNDPQDAAPGDLVFYDWGNGEGISHVAVVTRVDPSGYLEVADWSTNDKDGTIPSPTNDRGVTYSSVHHKWLQVRYPNVSAHLMHIVTTGSPGNP